MSKENFKFQAEVGKILNIVANSLYSEKEIFVREYISNASDACDKLKYESLQNRKISNSEDLKINIMSSFQTSSTIFDKFKFNAAHRCAELVGTKVSTFSVFQSGHKLGWTYSCFLGADFSMLRKYTC